MWLAFLLHYSTAVDSTTKKKVWTLALVHPLAYDHFDCLVRNSETVGHNKQITPHTYLLSEHTTRTLIFSVQEHNTLAETFQDT